MWGRKRKKKKVDLKEYAAKLPVGDSPEQIKMQNELFSWFDVSGNGSLSLAEVDLGILQFVGEEIFLMKPAIKMAFKVARGGAGGKDDDAVELEEFRTLLVSVRVYIELWVAFDELDENQDHRIEYDEFIAGIEMLKQWGVEIDNPKEEFKKVDDNGGGYILFDEFCEWALAKNLDYDPTFGVNISDEEIARHLAEAKAQQAKKKRGPRSYKLKRRTLKELPAFLKRVFEKRDPDKVEDISSLLKKHKGKEVQFIKKLVAEYGIKQEEIPEDLRKYTGRVRRKPQEQKTIQGLINAVHAMNKRHQQVATELRASNVLLEKKLTRQQEHLKRANKIIEQQQEEIDHMHRLVETFILQNGGTVFSFYQHSTDFDEGDFAGEPPSLPASPRNASTSISMSAKSPRSPLERQQSYGFYDHDATE